MDDCIQKVMLICMQVPSITAVGPIVAEKLTLMEKNKVTGPWNIGHKWPSFELELEITKSNYHIILSKMITSKMWPLEW